MPYLFFPYLVTPFQGFTESYPTVAIQLLPSSPPSSFLFPQYPFSLVLNIIFSYWKIACEKIRHVRI